MLRSGILVNIMKNSLKENLNPNNGHRYLPYIILVVDEFADLIMTAGKEIETPLTRLAQLARAIGIHLIIATQRPTVNIITGTIKANFPCELHSGLYQRLTQEQCLTQMVLTSLSEEAICCFLQAVTLLSLQCAFIDIHELETAYFFYWRPESIS